MQRYNKIKNTKKKLKKPYETRTKFYTLFIYVFHLVIYPVTNYECM